MNPFAFMPQPPRTLNEEGIKVIAQFKPNARFHSPEFLGKKTLTVNEALAAFKSGLPIEPVYSFKIGFVNE